ncbi:MAG: nucleotidyl transferase AbiEii/AbiGii toxin family protein [Pirellulales bacterium]|nr:nucleotidyl transferase AbiEii/AbiGii toxin family protein [Pirellulales bacterium]
MTSKSILAALDQVWRALTPLDIPMAVVGGVGLAAWEYPRFTLDVDLLISIGPSRQKELLETLRKYEILPKTTAGRVRLEMVDLMQFEYTPADSFASIQVDLLFARSDYHQQALNRVVTANLPDMEEEVKVLNCEDLLIHKLMAWRMRDRADAIAVLQANNDRLDATYMEQWVKALHLQEQWSEVRQAAISERNAGE